MAYTSTWKPGQRVVIDIVANPASRCVVPSWHHKYYLALSDQASRFFVIIGMKSKDTANILNGLQQWATCYGPDATFDLSKLIEIQQSSIEDSP
jgi:hypothetical protein